MNRMVAVAVSVTFVLVAGLGQAQASGHDVISAHDVMADCDQLTPAAETVDYLIPEAWEALSLDVLVVVDRRDVKAARSTFEVASGAFERVGIDLNWRFKRLEVPNLGFEIEPYLTWLKEQVGGVRPEGFDAVYLSTSHRLYGNGLADCIGGIADPERAFAVGALEWYGLVGVRVKGEEPLPGPPLADGGAKLVVHEIGHLLGAHHHYGPCGAPPQLEDPAHPCDVMNPVLVQQIGLHYGPINAAVVRRYAEQHLQP